MFAFCVESSHARGMGHLYRSMNLAALLVSRAYEVIFLINDDEVSRNILVHNGFLVETASLNDYDSNWEASCIRRHSINIWINDRLDTDQKHAQHVCAESIPLVTFDDRGSGATKAHLHIAALAFEDLENLQGAVVLSGINFLILNPEIARYRRVRSECEPLLVTLGGSDTWGVTVRVVNELARRNRSATVILGPGFDHDDELRQVLTNKIVIKRSVPSMIEEMSRYGLAITGGGITPFEANAAGLPCIIIANELFEVPVGRSLAGLGGSVFAGYRQEYDPSFFDLALPVKAMSLAGISKIGLDGANNVAEYLERLLAHA